MSERVADVLQPYLDKNLLIPAQRQPGDVEYRQHIIHVERDGSFSVVCLVWLPGQTTPIHDHVSWCVVGVYRGQENEIRYRLMTNEDASSPYLMRAGQSENHTGTVAALSPPGDIHEVMNGGSGVAISLHIYGADIGLLGSSIRRKYDLNVRPAG